jgi:streptogramin lyase
VSVGATPTFVATGGGSVWIASHSTGTLTRLDLRTNEVVQTILLGRPISGLAFAFGRIWVTST